MTTGSKPKGKTIDRKTLDRVIALRKKGATWIEIMEKLGQPRAFVLAVRPLMKEVDPTLVKPSYDRGEAKAAREQAARSGPHGSRRPPVR